MYTTHADVHNPHNPCRRTQPMQTYTTHADVHSPCRRTRPTQPMQTYTTHADVHNPCRRTQPMQTYTTHADNPCRPMQPMRRRWGNSNRWERTKGVRWVVLDGAGQREKTKGRRPWMGWGTVQPIQGRLSHLRGPQGPSGCPTCVGPQAAGDYWRGRTRAAVPLAWAPRPFGLSHLRGPPGRR